MSYLFPYLATTYYNRYIQKTVTLSFTLSLLPRFLTRVFVCEWLQYCIVSSLNTTASTANARCEIYQAGLQADSCFNVDNTYSDVRNDGDILEQLILTLMELW